MSGETGAEGGEPERFVFGGVFYSFFQRKEDRGAGHVAVAAEDFAGFGELKGWQRGFDGFDHIATTGVGDDLVGFFFES